MSLAFLPSGICHQCLTPHRQKNSSTQLSTTFLNPSTQTYILHRLQSSQPFPSPSTISMVADTSTKSSPLQQHRQQKQPSKSSPLSPSDLKSLMQQSCIQVEQACSAALTNPNEDKLTSMMRYALLGGGKRVRALLLLQSFYLFHTTPSSSSSTSRLYELMESQAVTAAVSVEMIHAMSLVHDDLPCMDNDSWRRGKKSTHVMFGEDMAVLVGDALLAKSFAVLGELVDGIYSLELDREDGNGVGMKERVREMLVKRVLRAIRLLAESVGQEGLAAGQVLDIENEGSRGGSLEVLERIHTYKTAALLRVSCAVGAILAGATDNQIEDLSRFATKVGIAFQVKDDVLDIEGNTEDLGKTAGKDIGLDKMTYVKLLGVEGAKRKAEGLIEEAKECLRDYGERANVLLGLADFIVSRKR